MKIGQLVPHMNFYKRRKAHIKCHCKELASKGLERGSWLPKPLTRENFIMEVWDIVILLNRIKGNSHAFYWEYWMYFYIQVLLASKKYLDWVQVIAERLHEGLSNFVGMSSFYMSSYLFYILACTREW